MSLEKAFIFYVISCVVIIAGFICGFVWDNWITAFVGIFLFTIAIYLLMLAPEEKRGNGNPSSR